MPAVSKGRKRRSKPKQCWKVLLYFEVTAIKQLDAFLLNTQKVAWWGGVHKRSPDEGVATKGSLSTGRNCILWSHFLLPEFIWAVFSAPVSIFCRWRSSGWAAWSRLPEVTQAGLSEFQPVSVWHRRQGLRDCYYHSSSRTFILWWVTLRKTKKGLFW